MSKYDIVIKNGRVVDGTGKDAYIADVAIKGDKIAAIGSFQESDASRVIDATGKIVCPGFIDTHSHADLNLLIWPHNEADVMQGVTTTISGNCGFSPAPVGDIYLFSAWEYNLVYEVTKDPYNIINFFNDIDAMKKAMKKTYNYDMDYKTMAEFFQKAEKAGFSVNYYPFVGHNPIRVEAMGKDCMREATPEELEKMKEILRREMKAGARGLSSGLDYPPGSCSTTDELVELAKVAKECGGMYVSHVRSAHINEKGEMEMSIIHGIKEAIEIGRRSGIRVHVSHILPAFDVSEDDSEEQKIKSAAEVLKLIDDAVADGVDISCDVIPNISGGGFSCNRLSFFLRPWVLECGSAGKLLERLDDPEYLKKVKYEMGTSNYTYANKNRLPVLPQWIMISRCDDPSFSGKIVSEIMADKGWEFEDTLINIFKADIKTNALLFLSTITPEFLKTVTRHPRVIPCSDGFSYDLDSNIGLSDELGQYPHPNNYCYSTRYILEYGKPRIEDTIRQMTGYPAERFFIKDRGILKEDYFADIVVLDMDKLKTNEDYIEPRNFPDGVDCVLINGVVTGEKKTHTQAKAGRILKG